MSQGDIGPRSDNSEESESLSTQVEEEEDQGNLSFLPMELAELILESGIIVEEATRIDPLPGNIKVTVRLLVNESESINMDSSESESNPYSRGFFDISSQSHSSGYKKR